jgi:hypothetical protein
MRKYIIVELASVSDETLQKTAPEIGLAVKSLDGTKALVKVMSEETPAGCTALSHAEALALLNTEDWPR